MLRRCWSRHLLSVLGIAGSLGLGASVLGAAALGALPSRANAPGAGALGANPTQYQRTSSATSSTLVGGPLAIALATIGQDGRDLTLMVRTRSPWSAHQLALQPQRSICLLLASPADAAPDRQACLRATGKRLSLTLESIAAGSRPLGERVIPAIVMRPNSRTVALRVAPSALRLASRPFGWQVRTTWVGGAACGGAPSVSPAPGPCVDMAPAAPARFALVAVHPVGCTAPTIPGPSGPTVLRGGPPNRRLVALTFDDGPSAYTPAILRVLERDHALATFFVIGRQLAGRAALPRRALRDGDAIGNHSWSHPVLVGAGTLASQQIQRTGKAIRGATGFTPCLFRAPYGATSRALVTLAAGLGYATIGWNVDPQDWARPGAAVIVQRVLSAVRPGSIVIMHDGGGPRDQTVAALPMIIAGLRARGLRLVTVPTLLGVRITYNR